MSGKKLTERYAGERRDGNEAIWDDATALSPKETNAAKVHVTLRLDADVYRAILAKKKAQKDRTITATVEKLLLDGLQSDSAREPDEPIRRMLRHLIAHSAVQDNVIEAISRTVKPRSTKDRQLVEAWLSRGPDDELEQIGVSLMPGPARPRSKKRAPSTR
jgi:hypothetical protein